MLKISGKSDKENVLKLSGFKYIGKYLSVEIYLIRECTHIT